MGTCFSRLWLRPRCPSSFRNPTRETVIAKPNAVKKERVWKNAGEWAGKRKIGTRKKFLAVVEECVCTWWFWGQRQLTEKVKLQRTGLRIMCARALMHPRTHVCTCIYIERERERERSAHTWASLVCYSSRDTVYLLLHGDVISNKSNQINLYRSWLYKA